MGDSGEGIFVTSLRANVDTGSQHAKNTQQVGSEHRPDHHTGRLTVTTLHYWTGLHPRPPYWQAYSHYTVMWQPLLVKWVQRLVSDVRVRVRVRSAFCSLGFSFTEHSHAA